MRSLLIIVTIFRKSSSQSLDKLFKKIQDTRNQPTFESERRNVLGKIQRTHPIGRQLQACSRTASWNYISDAIPLSETVGQNLSLNETSNPTAGISKRLYEQLDDFENQKGLST